MAILVGFDHKEVQTVYCATLMGFHGNFNGLGLRCLRTRGLSKDI